MPSRKFEFTEDIKIKVLLWCARHCCLCGKFAGVGIEIAHLERNLSDIDNAMPLCFDCHSAIGHYNEQHPRGRRYQVCELKARRSQVYEHHTQHLMSPIDYRLTQENRTLPNVGFHISHHGARHHLRARIRIALRKRINDAPVSPSTLGHYDGRYLWNLNPGKEVRGHFDLPEAMLVDKQRPIRARVDVTLYDVYDFEHKLLPVGFIHALGQQDWYYEPSEEEFGRA
jgi:hypothetical protein